MWKSSHGCLILSKPSRKTISEGWPEGRALHPFLWVRPPPFTPRNPSKSVTGAHNVETEILGSILYDRVKYPFPPRETLHSFLQVLEGNLNTPPTPKFKNCRFPIFLEEAAP